MLWLVNTLLVLLVTSAFAKLTVKIQICWQTGSGICSMVQQNVEMQNGLLYANADLFQLSWIGHPGPVYW